MEEDNQGMMFTKLAYSDIVYCPTVSSINPATPSPSPISVSSLVSLPLPSVAAVQLVR